MKSHIRVNTISQEISSLTKMEEHRLRRVVENTVLRKISEPKSYRLRGLVNAGMNLRVP